MNIVVCIKQVPDVPGIRIDRERMTLIREGVESVINPLDYVALQAALHLKGEGGGSVCVMTMGPPQSEAALREALAFGADRAVLLSAPAFAGADTLATSHVLARAISRLAPTPDLILCGMQTMDSDTGHVGPQIAEELDLPQVCGVSQIHAGNGELTVNRLSDGFIETVRVAMPVLLSVRRELARVRDLDLGSLEGAFSEAQIVRWGVKELELSEEEVGLKGSATQVWKLRPPAPRARGEILQGSPQILVRRLMEKLEALSMVDEEDAKAE
jgi:electron transfer flavoprotein alpha/beta subunit